MSRSVNYFSSENLRKDLKGKTVRGGLWILCSQVLIVVMQFMAIPILTRLLDATDFGLIAMVTVFTGFSTMFVDAGLTMSTIQCEKITHQQVSNLFWLAVGLGSAISLLIMAAAPVIAWFYSEPRLVPVTLTLATTPLLAGLTVQHQALLRRAMQLRQLSHVQVISTLLSYLFAVAIAWLYRSYWALVFLAISIAALRMLGVWVSCRWLPSFPKRDASVRSMVKFGANLTGFSFMNYFARSGDNMLLGWWWGAEPLGFYERAYKLMMAPLQQINSPLSSVMMPALSRLVGQPEKYRDAYFQAVAILQVVSCPIMGFVAIMAPQIVEVVFGSGFEESGPILRWLAIAGFIQPLTNSLGWLYISQGRGQELMRWGMLGSSLIFLSFIVGLPWGALGVARSYAVMIYFAIIPLAYWYVGATGPVSTSNLWRLTIVGVGQATPVAISSLVALFGTKHLASMSQLVWGVASAVLAWGVSILMSSHGRHTTRLLLNHIRFVGK